MQLSTLLALVATSVVVYADLTAIILPSSGSTRRDQNTVIIPCPGSGTYSGSSAPAPVSTQSTTSQDLVTINFEQGFDQTATIQPPANCQFTVGAVGKCTVDIKFIGAGCTRGYTMKIKGGNVGNRKLYDLAAQPYSLIAATVGSVATGPVTVQPASLTVVRVSVASPPSQVLTSLNQWTVSYSIAVTTSGTDASAYTGIYTDSGNSLGSIANGAISYTGTVSCGVSASTTTLPAPINIKACRAGVTSDCTPLQAVTFISPGTIPACPTIPVIITAIDHFDAPATTNGAYNAYVALSTAATGFPTSYPQSQFSIQVSLNNGAYTTIDQTTSNSGIYKISGLQCPTTDINVNFRVIAVYLPDPYSVNQPMLTFSADESECNKPNPFTATVNDVHVITSSLPLASNQWTVTFGGSIVQGPYYLTSIAIYGVPTTGTPVLIGSNITDSTCWSLNNANSVATLNLAVHRTAGDPILTCGAGKADLLTFAQNKYQQFQAALYWSTINGGLKRRSATLDASGSGVVQAVLTLPESADAVSSSSVSMVGGLGAALIAGLVAVL